MPVRTGPPHHENGRARQGPPAFQEDQPSKHLSLRNQVEDTTRQTRPARRAFDFRVRRRREIEAVGRDIGVAETDDLSRFLIAWVWHNAGSKDQVNAVIECARTMGRKGFSEDEAKDVIQEAKATRRAMSADNLARYLRLNYETRQALRITTIGACDANKRERRRRRKERDRQAKARQRRQRGADTRAEYLEANWISRTKPWVKKGLSRAQWYRYQKAARAQGSMRHETGPSTAVFLST
jgi:hypothetical protein